MRDPIRERKDQLERDIKESFRERGLHVPLLRNLKFSRPLDWRRYTREMKACEACGHVRPVKVAWDREKQAPFAWKHSTWPWQKWCTACSHLRNAHKYDRLAEQNRQQAAAIFARRARKQGESIIK